MDDQKKLFGMEVKKNIRVSVVENVVLNSSKKNIISQPICNPDTFVFDKDNLQNLPLQNLSLSLEHYITTLQCFCKEAIRLGNVGRGGFRICADEYVKPSPGCVVYNYHHELSEKFESQIRTKYNCSILNNGSEFSSISEFKNAIQKQVISSILILKIGTEDFPFLNDFFKSIRYYNLRKQIVLEIHFMEQNETRSDYIKLLTALMELKKSNCGTYWYERNWEFVKNKTITSREGVDCFTVNLFCYNASSISRRKSDDDVGRMDLPVVEPIGLGHMETADVKKNLAIFSKYAVKHQIFCQRVRRMGKIVDGGWDICDDERYRPKSPCLVYSFGINNDFSFDEDMERTYGCDVYAFDPSMESGDYNRSKHIRFYQVGLGDQNIRTESNWTLKTLKTLIKESGHENRRIDVLKMDIEGNEKQSLVEMIDSDALQNVLQLCVEFHTYFDIGAVRKLYDIGFRIFWSHQNPGAPLYTKDESFSYGNEISFVNINAT
ncbi:hypothetical protein FSP39_006053 [Pinctada imbricata]|uniref:Methyltransferase domain-containing protein n=1 Tax=Pinctada imbricata TaxID=66713 RepID=A0AA89C5C7_PINIB|nr:hypothetical protein FSP39_006053 [Pinctada imbricata]